MRDDRGSIILFPALLLAVTACNPSAPSSAGDDGDGMTAIDEGAETETETGDGGEPVCLPMEEVYRFDKDPIEVEQERNTGNLLVLFESPPEVHVLDPWSPDPEIYELPKTPLSFSSSPDGSELVVGHDGFISIIELQTGEQREVPVPTEVSSIVHGGNGRAYIPLPFEGFGSFDLLTEEVVEYPNVLGLPFGQYRGFRHPDLPYIFISDTGFSRIALEPDVVPLALETIRGSGRVWRSDDDTVMYSADRRYDVFADPDLMDLEEGGRLHALLPNGEAVPANRPESVAHVISMGEVAGLYDRIIRYFDPVDLISPERHTLPQVELDGVCEMSRGRYIFPSGDDETYWVISKLGGEPIDVSFTDPEGPMVLYSL